MVIDDNEIDLHIAQRVMKKYAFADGILLMDSAKEAVEYLSANSNKEDMLPDLIFLDINMPEMNGFEFLEAYTHLPEKIKKKCIIMMLTTSVNPEDQERANKSPYVHYYLGKPLDEEKLKGLTEYSKKI